MASVHEIGIASDTRAFDDGFKRGVIRPVEDAVQAFEDLERAAGDAGRDAARGVDTLEDSLRDAQRQSERLDDSMHDIGDGGVRGFDRVRGGAQELRQEIGQNLGETVSSFRGDLSDIGQVGQDTLGGLAATVAGIGGAGGILGALGLAGAAAAWGAFTQGQEDARVKQEELNESAARFAQGYTEGVNGAISAASIFAEINAITTDPTRYADARKAAEDWGVSVQTAMRALAGDSTAVALVQDGMAERTARANEMLAKQEQQVDSNAGAAYDYADAVERGKERLDTLTGAMAQGQQQAREAANALYDYAVSAGTATDQTDDLGNRIVRLPDGKEIVIDANTRTAYEDIDALERRRLSDKTFTARVTVDDSAVRNYRPPTITIPGQLVGRGMVAQF